jgi:hypothetical protein
MRVQKRLFQPLKYSFSLLCFILTIFMSIQLEESTNAVTWTHLEFAFPWNRIYRTKDHIVGIILKRAIRNSRENMHELNCITMCKSACTCIEIHFTFNLYVPALYIPLQYKFYWIFALHFEHIMLNFTFPWPCIMLWFLVDDQRHAQFFTTYLFLFLFLTLYMFRAHRAHHQERQIVSTQPLVTVTLYRWPCRVQVNCTRHGLSWWGARCARYR